MIRILWEFRVRTGKEREFEIAYRPGGVWAQLFARHPGYRGTILLRDLKDSARFVTVDSWESEEAFDDFNRNHREEYQRIDRQCEELTDSESKIGVFALRK